MPKSSQRFSHGLRRLGGDTDGDVERQMVRIEVDGETFEGLHGEPIAVTMMAAGVRVFLRMPKSGDPRGGFCFSGGCADCLVTVDGQPGVRACVTKVVEGMRVETHSMARRG